MAAPSSDFTQVVRDSACSMLNDPGAVSEVTVAGALKRRNMGAKINLQDAKELIQDYLRFMCERR